MNELEPFKILVKEVIKKAGISQNRKALRLLSAWASVCDENMKAHTRVSGFRGGVMEVEVDTHVILQELGGFRKAGLAEQLRKAMPGEIQDIRFVIYRGQ